MKMGISKEWIEYLRHLLKNRGDGKLLRLIKKIYKKIAYFV
jgi:hypothetical protein